MNKCESYFGCLHSKYHYFQLFFMAVKGRIGRIQRRLTEKEQKSIRPGSIFVYLQSETDIKRWTDGRCWRTSRVCGFSTVYLEKNGNLIKKVVKMEVPNDMLYAISYQDVTNEYTRECCKIYPEIKIDYDLIGNDFLGFIDQGTLGVSRCDIGIYLKNKIDKISTSYEEVPNNKFYDWEDSHAKFENYKDNFFVHNEDHKVKLNDERNRVYHENFKNDDETYFYTNNFKIKNNSNVVDLIPQQKLNNIMNNNNSDSDILHENHKTKTISGFNLSNDFYITTKSIRNEDMNSFNTLKQQNEVEINENERFNYNELSIFNQNTNNILDINLDISTYDDESIHITNNLGFFNDFSREFMDDDRNTFKYMKENGNQQEFMNTNSNESVKLNPINFDGNIRKLKPLKKLKSKINGDEFCETSDDDYF
ncbi:cAMP-independent regulatory protein pac2 [Dictyocoela muelleri]|nr:cAMP-independent regulatory protein pac2 [Dictyocoela muelleri]